MPSLDLDFVVMPNKNLNSKKRFNVTGFTAFSLFFFFLLKKKNLKN